MKNHMVLVIEDNTMNADVLRENLLDAGYASELATNGAAGVALANELYPDLILMDVNLPILDGLAATQLLKANPSTEGIPILALTARAMSGDRDRCLEAGCDDYVSKPVDMDVLFAKMQYHLARRTPFQVEVLHRQRSEASAPGRARGLPGAAPTPAETERDALRTERDALRTERDALHTERDALADERGALISERDALRSVQGTLLAERDTLLAERDALRTERDLLRTERANLLAQQDALQTERGSLQTQIRRLQEQRDTPSGQADATTQAPSQEARQLEEARAQILALQQQLEATPSDLRTLQIQHEGLRAAFRKLHTEVTAAAEEASRQITFLDP